jgi:hypothetical protein
MQNYSRLSVAASSVFVLFAVACAHPQTVTLTSAQASVPVPAPAPAAPAPAAAVPAEATATPEAAAGDAKPATSDGPMSFEQLSAALGGEDKMGLEMQRTEQAPAGKGLSADGYSSVSAAHQAVDSSSSHLGGDITVSGGLTSVAVRAGVHTEAARLRACYEHGLSQNPHLAGRVTVSFSVDERGAVGDVDAQSDAIPGDVTSCIRQAFSAMTFSAPKAPPAKVVYPIDFNKDS